ncbi:MAG: Metal-dependent hydrolases of the beta-lactamase superfamily III, partial [uncultured Frankineae bacterium]
EADGPGLLGHLPRPRLALLGLPGRARRLPARPRPRLRCAGPAAALDRPARDRRGLRQPPARRPLHRPGRAVLRPPLPPRRPAGPAARLRSRGPRRPAVPGLRGGAGGPAGAGVRLPRGAGRDPVDRPVHRHDAAHGPPGGVPRPARRGRRTDPGLLRRHRRHAAARAAGRGRRRVPVRGELAGRPGLAQRPAPVRPPGRRARRPGPREAPAAHAPDALDRPHGDGRRGGADVRRPARGGPLGCHLRHL